MFSIQKNPRVLIVGDVMLDRYWHGATQRISPEAPVPIVRVQRHEDRAGGAANVALNARTLGAQVGLLGVVGQDENAMLLAHFLQKNHINWRPVFSENQPTISKLRIMSRQQQLLRVDQEEYFEINLQNILFEVGLSSLQNADILVLSDYAKGTLHAPERLIHAAKKQQKPIVIDPKGQNWRKYAGATLLTPNVAEIEAVHGVCADQAALVRAGQKTIAELDLQALLITRSEHGMTLLQKNGQVLHLPTMAREVFDVTGAGDTVVATLAVALAAGENLEDSCRYANQAAGIVVGKLGTSTVSYAELCAIQTTNDAKSQAISPDEIQFGVLSEANLIQQIQNIKSKKAKIVMTNGCFDLLHPGHLRYLQAARALGDYLIVAVNADESVRRLKGEARPLNNVADRMEILAGLACVDWVVPFGEDTPARLIGEILPDILVKGGDYVPEAIAGSAAVWANGGEVLVLAFHEGHSTTATIRKMTG